jgi:hypothetical protein
MKCLAILLLLTGCAADQSMRDELEYKHLAWSGKKETYQDVTVEMNSWGLLYLKIDDKIVAQRHNWCVEIVEYQP